MGGIASRINFESLNPGRRRSQNDEPLYSYSLNKNYFSNFFLMGGERFEVNDPDYLFGDICDLNFLSCSKPSTLPYKKARLNLLASLNAKQRDNSKASGRVHVGLSTPFLKLTSRSVPTSQCVKQDAQTQTLNDAGKNFRDGREPSRPLIMLINIRKETLRLVKSTNVFNLDGEANSTAQNMTASLETVKGNDALCGQTSSHLNMLESSSSSSIKRLASRSSCSKLDACSGQLSNKDRLSNNGSKLMSATVHNNKDGETPSSNNINNNNNNKSATARTRANRYKRHRHHEQDATSDNSSPISTNPSCAELGQDSHSETVSVGSSKSGYTSVKDVPPSPLSASGEDDDENFEDALNDSTNLSASKEGEDDSDRAQQARSLLRESTTKDNSDTRISIVPKQFGTTNLGSDLLKDSLEDDADTCDESSVRISNPNRRHKHGEVIYMKRKSTESRAQDGSLAARRGSFEEQIQFDNKVYNIEFQFDAEVDCSIRIFYFCTREISSSGLAYKPQHATHKSKVYIYKKGMGQKFEQQEHTFQPYLFDDDLLTYKPLDLEGNYNSGSVFPIVIQCVALDGPKPRQSQSLVATIEKSQLDESYSIKPLKQLIFVDGVQYILQDIYGIENKALVKGAKSAPGRNSTSSKLRKSVEVKLERNADSSLRSSVASISSATIRQLNHQFSDTASIASGLIIDGHRMFNAFNGDSNDELDEDEAGDDELDGLDGEHESVQRRKHETKNSLTSVTTLVTRQQPLQSMSSENNSFECVVCMSDERDTLLLPCRHLCLCSSCAQSLRYQANSCPICRCPFRAALNLRIMRNSARRRAPAASHDQERQGRRRPSQNR